MVRERVHEVDSRKTRQRYFRGEVGQDGMDEGGEDGGGFGVAAERGDAEEGAVPSGVTLVVWASLWIAHERALEPLDAGEFDR